MKWNPPLGNYHLLFHAVIPSNDGIIVINTIQSQGKNSSQRNFYPTMMKSIHKGQMYTLFLLRYYAAISVNSLANRGISMYIFSSENIRRINHT
jgi:hypothetical protein